MLSLELWQVANQFIESQISVEELEDWLVPRLPAIMQSPDSADADVAATIELGLAEMSHDIINEAQLRAEIARELKKYLTLLTMYPDPSRRPVQMTSSSQTSAVLFPASWALTPTSLVPNR